jgi:hypothetical protein
MTKRIRTSTLLRRAAKYAFKHPETPRLSQIFPYLTLSCLNYVNLFKPHWTCSVFWFDNNEQRVLSYLFAADIAESEGD